MDGSEEKTPLLTSHGQGTTKKKRRVTVSESAPIVTEIESEFVISQEVRLQKHITLPVTCAIIIGNVIGSGIFVSPVGVAAAVRSVGATLVVWATVGLYCLVQALCYAELGTMIPKAGGDYAYVYYILGPLPAFLCVWMHVAMICTSSNAAIGRTAAIYLVKPLGLDCNLSLVILISILIIATFAVLNIRSTILATKVQNVFSTGKVVALVIIIIMGVIQLAKGNTGNFQDPFKGTSQDVGLFAIAVLDGYFAFKGWELVNTLPEEMVNPKRDLPLGIVISMVGITLIYVLTNVAYFSVLSLDQLITSDAVALSFSEVAMPKAWWLVSLFVVVSCCGTINGHLLSDNRYLFAAGRFDQVPRMFAMLSYKYFTPVLSIIIIALISCCYTLIPTISELVEYASLGVQLKIMLSLVALIYVRWTRPDIRRPLKVPIVVTWLTLAFLLALIGVSFYKNPRVTGTGVGLFAAGVPVYLLGTWLARREAVLGIVDNITVLAQCMLHIVPESRRGRKYTLRIEDMFPKTLDKADDFENKAIASDKFVH